MGSKKSSEEARSLIIIWSFECLKFPSIGVLCQVHWMQDNGCGKIIVDLEMLAVVIHALYFVS